MVDVLFKRFDTTIAFPEKKTPHAACVDLSARTTTTISAKSIGYIPLNIAMKMPSGYWGLLAARSSTHKLGLICANGIGIIDQDFCGDADELKFVVYNITDQDVVVEKGTRIAQVTFVPQHAYTITETEQLTAPNRGGIGSTGF